MNSRQRMHEKLILRVVAKAFTPFILLFALYVQFHGDFGPGGGFQAGVIFAAGLIVYAMIFGLNALEEAIPSRVVEGTISFGVLLYAGVGFWALFSGGEFLNYSALDPEHPAHGQHVGILIIELGVGITVAAVMVAIYSAFAGRKRD